MEKYITIPAEDLSKKERRVHPDGKQVLNPEWEAVQKQATFENDAIAQALIAAGGEKVGNEVEIKFRGHTLAYRIGSDFKSGGASEDKIIGAMRRELGI